MLNCGITGHTGVLGSYLIKKLKYRFIKFNGDITNLKDVEKWINKNNFDYIIHLAAIVPTIYVEKKFAYSKKVNFLGTKNLVDSLIKFKKKPKNFFFSSTSHVYKPTSQLTNLKETDEVRPYSKYGKTKLLAEKYIQKRFKKTKINFCIGRIFSFTHKKQSQSFIVPNIFKKIKSSKSKEIFLENLNHNRDFVSLNDISKAIDIILKKSIIGIINIGNGRKINLLSIAKFFCKKYNIKLINHINKNPTYLISNNRRLIKYGWRPKVNFFKELKNFK